MLSIQNLTKRYPNGLVALQEVSIDIPAGEVLALIGPSGAGKSTLIRCLNRLVEPTSGEVWLDDVNICALSPRRLRAERRSMGMIFQEYALVEQLSVMENVLSGRLGSVGFWRSALRRFPAEDVEGAVALLERLGLAQYLNTRADQLSGGQRQRVGIARALLQRPKLLLIDEPTASLDPRTARDTMRLILELVTERNLAAIINIHDVTLARAFTQRIVGLAAGSIVFDGPPDKLDDAALTEIYGAEDWSADPKADEDNSLRELDQVVG